MRSLISRVAVVVAVCAAIAGSGCSNNAASVTSGAAATAKPPAPTVAGVQSTMADISNNPNLTAAQKKIMLDEGRHELAVVQNGAPSGK
jgi:hypothetical protein